MKFNQQIAELYKVFGIINETPMVEPNFTPSAHSLDNLAINVSFAKQLQDNEIVKYIDEYPVFLHNSDYYITTIDRLYIIGQFMGNVLDNNNFKFTHAWNLRQYPDTARLYWGSDNNFGNYSFRVYSKDVQVG